MIRVAINGYGRIGRVAHRVILEKYSSQIEVAAVNVGPPADVKTWAYLLKYDTAYGMIKNPSIKSEIRSTKSEISPNDSSFAKVSMDKSGDKQNSNYLNRDDFIGSIIIDEKEIPVFSELNPNLLPWRDLNIDVAIESSGKFLKKEDLEKHLQAGAKAVVLSAPAKGGNVPTYVVSVNDQNYQGEKIINNASCTTNCVSPVAKIILKHFGIEKAMMTTIHAYTSDQHLQDSGHKDYRRARAAGQNIIPTSTGATEAAAKTIPELEGLFTGLAVRVPVVVGSLSDFTFLLKRNTTKEEINEVFKSEAENSSYKGILEVTEDPIVSSDIIGNSHSAIVDLSLTQVVGGNLAKVIAWYDNEYGYANRLVEEVLMVGKQVSVNENNANRV